MRKLVTGKVLAVRAIGGLHVVTLAWDFVKARTRNASGCSASRSSGRSSRRGPWSSATSCAASSGSRARTRDCRRARRCPPPSTPSSPSSGATTRRSPTPPTATRSSPSTESRSSSSSTRRRQSPWRSRPRPRRAATVGMASPAHDIYFNRGAAGSQAYARKFEETKPDQTKPESEQMTWLSRGLFEALTRFIARAAGDDAATTRSAPCSTSSSTCRSARRSPPPGRREPTSTSATRPSPTRTTTKR